MRDDELRRVAAARLGSQDRNAVADGADQRRGSGSLAGLRERLDTLPVDHPSAPGRRELTADRLTRAAMPDYGQGSPADQPAPLTDAEYAEHVTDVRERLGDAQAAGLGDRRMEHAEGQVWSADQVAMHISIVADLLARAASVPRDGMAIIAGGLPGSGKTTVLREQADIDLSRYLMINPDDIKAEMARRGMIPEVADLSPMEASDLVHEEASAISKQLARRAMAERINVIWDITMSSKESTADRVSALRAAGYTQVDGIFVDIPIEVSVRRADARHRQDHEAYRAGTGFGGRYVPPEVIRSQADGKWGCENRGAYEDVKAALNHADRYDNSVRACGRRAHRGG